MKIYPVLLFSLLLGASSTKAAKPYDSADGSSRIFAELPYTDNFGVPIIEVRINENTYRFILDTGASILCITDRVARREGLDIKKSKYRFKNLQGRLSTSEIPQFTMGNIVMAKQEVVVLDSHNPIFRVMDVDGIIGGTVLEHFVVTFDSRLKVIILSRDRENLDITDWAKFRLWRNLPLFNVRLTDKSGERHKIKALFDSGNGTGSVVIPNVKEFEKYIAKGIVRGVEEGIGMTSRMIGGLGKSSKLYRGAIVELDMGNSDISDVPVMTGGLAYMLLCWKITDLGRLTIDYPRKRYGFTPYDDEKTWTLTAYPVMTAVEGGKLIVASVWDKQLRRVLQPGDIITAIGDRFIINPDDTSTPNIDELIGQYVTDENQTVTITDSCGVRHILPSGIFLP